MTNSLKTFAIAALTGIFLSGCGNTDNTAGQADEATHDEHHHHAGHGPIELDSGEKWAVNEEMKPFVSAGIGLVDDYIANGESDYHALAGNLKEQNDQLIRSCTMTGKGHDELHKWLHPHLELVHQLENTTDDTQADGLVTQLQDSYDLYGEYFQ